MGGGGGGGGDVVSSVGPGGQGPMQTLAAVLVV